MARTITPTCASCRREGEKLFLKGERCYTDKCSFTRRSYAPGQHGLSRRPKRSEYGTQLRAKQKAKAIYGVLERQFSQYYEQMNTGQHGQSLLQLVERRLDNVLYRLGLAVSRKSARQMLLHGHVMINGRPVTIPSYQVRVGDKITLDHPSDIVHKQIQDIAKKTQPVSWLKASSDGKSGEVTSLPTAEDVKESIEESLIVEFYSR